MKIVKALALSLLCGLALPSFAQDEPQPEPSIIDLATGEEDLYLVRVNEVVTATIRAVEVVTTEQEPVKLILEITVLPTDIDAAATYMRAEVLQGSELPQENTIVLTNDKFEPLDTPVAISLSISQADQMVITGAIDKIEFTATNHASDTGDE
jgi:hypothetical protein